MQVYKNVFIQHFNTSGRKFDVWLTVHRSSMWIKRPTRCHLVLYLFLLYSLLNIFRATLCPSSGADDLVVFFRCVAVPWLCRQSDPVGCLSVHWEALNTSAKGFPDKTDKQPTGSDCLHSHGTATHLKNTTKSSAPEDGHKVARNMSIGKHLAQVLRASQTRQTSSQPDLTAYTATALQHAWKIRLSRQVLKMGTS